jgi:hypothetical protein
MPAGDGDIVDAPTAADTVDVRSSAMSRQTPAAIHPRTIRYRGWKHGVDGEGKIGRCIVD